MIVPVYANKIKYQTQNDKCSSQNLLQPSFGQNPMKYVTGTMEWTGDNMSRFDDIINEKNNFKKLLDRNESNIRKIVESDFTNPFNCKVLLNYTYSLDSRRIFENADIHKGLAQLSYNTPDEFAKLRIFFQYCTDRLLLKENEFFPNEGIRQAIIHENTNYLSFLMNERMLIPYNRNGEIDSKTVMLGRSSENPNIRMFFDDNFLMHKAKRHDYFSRGLYNEPFVLRDVKFEDVLIGERELAAMSPQENLDYLAQDNFGHIMKRIRTDEEHYRNANQFQYAEPKVLYKPTPSKINAEQIKEIYRNVTSSLRSDEDKFGQARLKTLFQITNGEDFMCIKDAPLNIAGGRLQHLLAETYINPTDKSEVQMAKSILEKLKETGANLDVFDELGETALKRAVDAENTIIVKYLTEICKANPLACSKDAKSAFEAAELSTNADIYNIFRDLK